MNLPIICIEQLQDSEFQNFCSGSAKFWSWSNSYSPTSHHLQNTVEAHTIWQSLKWNSTTKVGLGSQNRHIHCCRPRAVAWEAAVGQRLQALVCSPPKKNSLPEQQERGGLFCPPIILICPANILPTLRPCADPSESVTRLDFISAR